MKQKKNRVYTICMNNRVNNFTKYEIKETLKKNKYTKECSDRFIIIL